MPKIARPADGGWAEEPATALGNRLHIGIIGYLRREPDRTSAQIAAALGIGRPTVSAGLERLLDLNLILADPPRDTATRGQWIRYRPNNPVITEMWLQLGQAMQEL